MCCAVWPPQVPGRDGKMPGSSCLHLGITPLLVRGCLVGLRGPARGPATHQPRAQPAGPDHLPARPSTPRSAPQWPPPFLPPRRCPSLHPSRPRRPPPSTQPRSLPSLLPKGFHILNLWKTLILAGFPGHPWAPCGGSDPRTPDVRLWAREDPCLHSPAAHLSCRSRRAWLEHGPCPRSSVIVEGRAPRSRLPAHPLHLPLPTSPCPSNKPKPTRGRTRDWGPSHGEEGGGRDRGAAVLQCSGPVCTVPHLL